jgi:hypothetical protein
LLSWLTSAIDPHALGLARIIVGAAALIRAILAWPVLMALTDPGVLTIPYADWLPDPTRPLVASILVVWMVSALLFAVGWRVPLSGSALLASLVATLSLDQQTYGNHLYLMSWLVLLMVVADAGAGLSVSKRSRRIVRWPVLLIMLQLSVVYGFSGLTKLNERFLSGETLAGAVRAGVLPFPDSLRMPAFLSVLAGVVIVVELFIALLIWRNRFRPAAFVLGLGLHTSITLFMANTGELFVFSLEMLAIYPLFLGGAVLTIRAPEGGEWARRIRRFDVLRVTSIEHDPTLDDLVLCHRGNTTMGGPAHTRILEHMVPWLWVAPLLRVPGLSHLHQRLHRSREDMVSAADAQ